jgi:hypothetical protein
MIRSSSRLAEFSVASYRAMSGAIFEREKCGEFLT